MNAALVTCIMPTRDRRRFVPRAIDCFLQQDYPQLELLIADDGQDGVADLVPDDPRIRYLRLDGPLRIGAKRNAACAAARGEFIVHWDDDDWSAPWRVSYQVQSMTACGADVSGLSHILFFEPGHDRGWEYIYPETSRPWVHGATLAYRASFWRRNPFPDIQVGEDTRFVWSDRGQLVHALGRHTCFVGTIHGGNTSPKRTGDQRWRPTAPAALATALGPDWQHYCRTMGVAA